MITRLRWFVYSTFWRFALWLYGPWRICYNCVECAEDMWEPDDIEFWCRFRDKEIDPNNHGCRAFRGWRRH